MEACVDSFESAIEAELGGATRVELCSSLREGGLTPSYGMTKMVKKALKIPVHVLIRPRGGDFIYSDAEFEIMLEDIRASKLLDADGVVFGALDSNGNIDEAKIEIIMYLCKQLYLSSTFHRAFDHTIDPLKAIDKLIKFGVDRVLTSGKQSNAFDGLDLINDLIKYANGKITIICGGGINAENVFEIASSSQESEIHFSAKQKKKSMCKYWNDSCPFRNSSSIEEYEWYVTSETKVSKIVQECRKAKSWI